MSHMELEHKIFNLVQPICLSSEKICVGNEEKRKKKMPITKKGEEMQKGLEARTREIYYFRLSRQFVRNEGEGGGSFLAFLLCEISPADFFSFFPKRRINSAPYFTLGGVV